MPDRPRIRDLGEFALLEAIHEQLARDGVSASPPLVIGPGDDAAVLSPPPGRELVWTCDVQVAGRHFPPAVLPARDIGYRAMQVCLSDLAAMGAQPLAVLISLGLTEDMFVADVLDFHAGFAVALEPFSAFVAGGNVTRVDGPFFLDLSVIGTVAAGRALRRSGARAGDAIFVTGCPGASAAGLAWIRDRLDLETPGRPGASTEMMGRLLAREPWAAPLVDAYLRPRARIEAGLLLAAESLATAAIDISDGWGGDLLHLCRKSGVRARVRLSDFPRAVLLPAATALGVDPSDWQLGPSDDYELLFTTAPSHIDRVREFASFGLEAVLVGCIEEGPAEVRIDDAPAARGWDHFMSDPGQ